jgi:hypothetical protein
VDRVLARDSCERSSRIGLPARDLFRRFEVVQEAAAPRASSVGGEGGEASLPTSLETASNRLLLRVSLVPLGGSSG